MNPRLVAVAGPQQGTTFPLSGDEMTIGRDSSNWICITDLSASRKHCVVSRVKDEFLLSDLQSRHGTFVNGIPAQQRTLQHGDRIDVGNSSFLFLLTEEAPASAPFQFSEIGVLTTSRLRVEDSLYLKPEKMLSSSALTGRMLGGLETLLKFSRSIQAIRDVECLQKELLDSVFEITPAERGSVVLLNKNSGETESVYSCDRSLQRSSVSLSGVVIQMVTRERSALFSNEVLEDAGSHGNAVPLPRVHALMAVPLMRSEQILGILYMDAFDASVRFDEDHLQLISAIAAVGAVTLENLRYIEMLLQDQKRILEDVRIEHNMIGESESLKKVLGVIEKAARTDSTVLLVGESGTGKELAARAIHLNSPRWNKPFVAINCANLSESLLESELFGHEKGSFTGALTQKNGKLETADGGTVFLDEIAELAPALQSRILRVLQEREFARVGGIRPIQVDIRLIAATNKDLKEAMQAEKFRQDLYYRLNVVQITLPPLRERREDIPLLASYFASKHSKKCGRSIMGISQEARSCLSKYDWPGNVRQLENVIERAVVLGTDNLIHREDLPEEVVEGTSAPVTRYQDLLTQTKKKLVQEALQQADGNQTEAARILGVHPNNLRRMLSTLNLKPGT